MQKTNFMHAVFIAVVFFPFVVIVPLLPTDLQPNALLFCALVFVYLLSQGKIILNKEQVILLFSLVGVLGVIPIREFTMETIRSITNYISIFMISLVSLYYFKKYGLKENAIKICILIWCFVGAVQYFIHIDFLTSLLRLARTTESRGVTSLSQEPSFYGIILFFFMFFVKDFKRHRIFFFALIVVQSLLFSQSALGIILLFIFFLMFLFGDMSGKIQIRIGVLGAILGIIMFHIIRTFFYGRRIAFLLNSFLTGDILRDESVQDRYFAITDSISGTVNNFFLPHGFYARIMSGFGAVLYELGLLGFPLIFVICMAIANCFNRNKVLLMLLAFVSLLPAIQLAHPMLALVVGYGWYKRCLREDSKIKNITNDHIVSGHNISLSKYDKRGL